MICSCGRTLLACIPDDADLNEAHDRLVLQRFVDGAERHSPLKRARLGYEVQAILIERGRIARADGLTDDKLVSIALLEVPRCERVS